MGAKSAIATRFGGRGGVRLARVPKSKRPTVESIEKAGRKIAPRIRSNDAARRRSAAGAAGRAVC